jgi:hypothetical protein
MPSLRSSISDLATHFASSVLAAIRRASLDDILAESAGAQPVRRGPGRPRGARPAAPTAPKPAAKESASRGTSKRTAKKSKPGRLARRTPADIAKALGAVVELVKKNPKGLRAEQIRAELKMSVREMPRVLKEGLTKKALKSKGQKRATTYTAG